MQMLFTIGYYVLGALALTIGLALVLLQTNVIPGYEILIVQSGSMEPAIQTGGIVFIKASDTYALNDVITFGGSDSADSLPTTHRIIGDAIMSGSIMYTTKGDANEEADIERVAKSSIRGKVLFTIPYVGYILDFARQPLGFALLIGVPAFLIVIEEIGNIYGAVRPTRKKKEEEGTEEKEDTSTTT